MAKRVKVKQRPVFTSYEYDDTHMDKLPRLGPMQVDGNKITTELAFRDLRDKLWIGESVRLPMFFVNQDYPCLSKLRFELRLYPNGQFHSPKAFNVYLVMVGCPQDQHQASQMFASLTVGVTAQKLVFEDTRYKHFIWENRNERWLRMHIPLSQIRYRSKLTFCVRIMADHYCAIVRPLTTTQYQSMSRRIAKKKRNNGRDSPKISKRK